MRFQGPPRAQGRFCCPRVPWLSFPSLFFPQLVCPLHSSSFPQQLRRVLEKRAAPPAPSSPSQAQARCWQGTPRPGQDRGARLGKALQGSPSPPSALPGVPSTLEAAGFVCCATSVSPRSPRAVPGQHPQGMATDTAGEPRDARPRHAHLFPFPFAPWGSGAGCFPCAPAEPGGGHVPAVPAVPGAGSRPGAGAGRARVSSAALLQRRSGQRERGERGGKGGGEGGNETLIAQSPFCFPAYGIFHTC